MVLTDSELALFAELLDEVPGETPALLRDRIETYLYLKGHYERPDMFYDEVFGCWVARDGLYEAFGATEAEALAELKRNMGK